MKTFILGLLSTLLFFGGFQNAPLYSADPTPCIVGQFSSQGNQDWKNITLKITNNCNTSVDLQDATITFENNTNLDTEFWGNFDPLSYPDIDLRITTQKSGSKYLSTLHLHFPTSTIDISKLPVGQSIDLKFGAKTNAFVNGTVKVYLAQNVPTSSIVITNSSAKPSYVTQKYAVVHLMANGQNVTDIQVPWQSSKTVSGLMPSTYTLTTDSVSGSNSTIYQGTVDPNKINLASRQSIPATVSYATVQQPGSVSIQLQALPSELSGYTEKPVAVVTQSGGSSSVNANLNWNSTTTIRQLNRGETYSFSAPVINYKGVQWNPIFSPASLIANSTTIPVTHLTYQRVNIPENAVLIEVTKAPKSLTSLNVKLKPILGSGVINVTIPISEGGGSNQVLLPNGMSYTVTADAVEKYVLSYMPQPLISKADAMEMITLSPETSKTPVEVNGQLKVIGNQLCDERGQPIQLKGLSTHGIQWFGNCLTDESLDALVNNFKANVLRISLYVQEDGYETDPVGFTNQVNQLIKQVSDRGIYAIIDWHTLTPGDPNYNFDRAKKFFTDIINANKGRKNLIYEICNEPNGVDWATIKSYADKIIPVIRALDPNSVILVGTSGWSSLGVSDGSTSEDIVRSPVEFPNIMYTFHFYAASHRDEYLNELDRASNSLPIFVSEFGAQSFTGDGPNDFAMTDRYIDLMGIKKISWIYWNFSDDSQTGPVWKPGTCPNGPWTDSNMKAAGVYIKGKIRS